MTSVKISTTDELLAVAQLYFALSDHLGVNDMLTAVAALQRADRAADAVEKLVTDGLAPAQQAFH